MRKITVLLIFVLSLICLVSCATGPVKNSSEQFPLTQTQKSQSTSGLLRGTVNFGAGYFFPTSNDIIDISMLKTDGTTGLITEISHSRIRRPPNFPIQFSMSYDTADVSEGDTCTLIVTLLVGDEITRQGMTLLTRTENGFVDASLTLLGI